MVFILYIILRIKQKENKLKQGGPICSAVMITTLVVVVKFFGSLFYSYFFSAADVEIEVAALIHNHLVANT